MLNSFVSHVFGGKGIFAVEHETEKEFFQGITIFATVCLGFQKTTHS